MALLHGAESGQNADEWQSITERGSFALAAWCKKHGIEDAPARMFDLLATERDEEELESKALRPEPEPLAMDEVKLLDLRCSIYGSLSRRLLHEDLPDPARKLTR